MLADGAEMSERHGEASRFTINPISHTCQAGRRQENLCSECGCVSLSFLGLPYNLSSEMGTKNLCPAPRKGKQSGCVPGSLA